LVVRLSLPLDAPFQIFAIARCTGWIAHALEQSKTDKLTRPRARYVGVQPIDGISNEAKGVGALEGFWR
jgi:citrate synthase